MTSIFRIFTVIPIGIVLEAVAGGTWEWSYGNGTTGAAAGYAVTLVTDIYPPFRLAP